MYFFFHQSFFFEIDTLIVYVFNINVQSFIIPIKGNFKKFFISLIYWINHFRQEKDKKYIQTNF